MRPNGWLLAGGVLSAIAAALHLAIIVAGPAWYRFFGAGEGMARLAERGSPTPTLITLAIAAVLSISSAYAFAGSGLLSRPPLLRTGLVLSSAVYLLRGLAPFPTFLLRPEQATDFLIWSSLIVLGYGLAYAVGTWTAWPALSP